MIERKTMNIFQLDRKKTIDDIIEIRKQAKRGENVDELIHHPDSMVREFALKHKPALVKELEPNQLKQIINMFTEYLKQHNDERLNLQGMQYKLRALEYEPTIMEKSMDINQLFDLDIPIWAAELTPFAIKHILMMKPTVDKANLGAEYMYLVCIRKKGGKTMTHYPEFITREIDDECREIGKLRWKYFEQDEYRSLYSVLAEKSKNNPYTNIREQYMYYIDIYILLNYITNGQIDTTKSQIDEFGDLLKNAIIENKNNSEINWLAIHEYIDERQNPEYLEPNKYDQLCYQVFQEFDKELNNQDTFCLY